uniref:Putative ubiquinone biosynthesis protein UbiB n=1 Tax=Lygus hesperus TaxID=30085 RepID=A0A0A9WKI4_LYGHE
MLHRFPFRAAHSRKLQIGFSQLRLPLNIELAMQETSLQHFTENFPQQIYIHREVGRVQLSIETDFKTSFRMLCSPVCASLLCLLAEQTGMTNQVVVTVQSCARYLRIPNMCVQSATQFMQKKRIVSCIPPAVVLAFALYARCANLPVQFPTKCDGHSRTQFPPNSALICIDGGSDCSVCNALRDGSTLSPLHFLYLDSIPYTNSVLSVQRHVTQTVDNGFSFCTLNLYGSSGSYCDAIHTAHFTQLACNRFEYPSHGIAQLFKSVHDTNTFARGYVTILNPITLTLLHLYAGAYDCASQL